MKRVLASAIVAIVTIAGAPVRGAESAPSEETAARRFDVGARLGYARPIGAYDVGTRANDTSHGGIPIALDATMRVWPARWAVAVGVFGSWAETIPKLCGSAPECIASLGRDLELGLLTRVRGPRLAFVLPEAEIGSGFFWSSRYLVDNDVTSTRRWSGPVLVRAALVPSFQLGARTRIGFVLGGSVARASSFELEGPGVERRGLEGARLHGSLDFAVRFGLEPAE